MTVGYQIWKEKGIGEDLQLASMATVGSHGVPAGTDRWDKAMGAGVGGEKLCDPLEMGEGEGGRWSAVERWN